ncbi:MAG TPA: SDR family NAD(P)-dependent oxidoreductase, partial [Puia sp.]
NPVGDMSVEGWNHIIAVNLSSVFYCMKFEIGAMLKKGKGVIINMSSILGAVSQWMTPIYLRITIDGLEEELSKAPANRPMKKNPCNKIHFLPLISCGADKGQLPL